MTFFTGLTHDVEGGGGAWRGALGVDCLALVVPSWMPSHLNKLKLGKVHLDLMATFCNTRDWVLITMPASWSWLSSRPWGGCTHSHHFSTYSTCIFTPRVGFEKLERGLYVAAVDKEYQRRVLGRFLFIFPTFPIWRDICVCKRKICIRQSVKILNLSEIYISFISSSFLAAGPVLLCTNRVWSSSLSSLSKNALRI